MDGDRGYSQKARFVYRFLIVLCTLLLVIAVAALYFYPERPELAVEPPADRPVVDPEAVVEGIHLRTGLIASEGYREVINNCTGCHSASLVTQNRMDAKGWDATIKWMQEKQNLWELGDKQEVIIRYLVNNYPVEKKGRRQPLKDIEWYTLKTEK